MDQAFLKDVLDSIQVAYEKKEGVTIEGELFSKEDVERLMHFQVFESLHDLAKEGGEAWDKEVEKIEDILHTHQAFLRFMKVARNRFITSNK